MQNIIMILLAVVAAILYFSPETLMLVPENDLLKKIKENSKLVALACGAGAGYLYYTSTQSTSPTRQRSTPSVESTAPAPASELPTYEQSVSSQQ